MATLITLIGLVLVLVGVGCGIVAYNRTRREHGGGPLWPWASGVARRLRNWLVRLTPWLRRDAVVEVLSPAMEHEEALPIRAIKSGLRVPEDAPLGEQIRLWSSGWSRWNSRLRRIGSNTRPMSGQCVPR